jgi:hypothetical protein
VPELVEHGVRPALVVRDVREHADVSLPVDVDAKGVLILARARKEVAAREDAFHFEVDALEGAPGEADDVVPLEERIEVHRPVGRRLLEERVGVVPRP